MQEPGGSELSQQRTINQHFEASSGYWKNVYLQDEVEAAIYQTRHRVAVRWIDELELSPGSRVLDLGCGAGFLSAELVARGYTVCALDSVRSMIDATRETVRQDSSGTLSVALGDAHQLPCASGVFDLVVALGLFPWLHSEQRALAEIVRTLKPNGFLILSADNKLRLNRLIDPRINPIWDGLRNTLKPVLSRLGYRNNGSSVYGRMHYPAEVDQLIGASGLSKAKAASIGFGPFSFFGSKVLPTSVGSNLNKTLQRLADRGFPIVSSTGSHYLLLCRKTVKANQNDKSRSKSGSYH